MPHPLRTPARLFVWIPLVLVLLLCVPASLARPGAPQTPAQRVAWAWEQAQASGSYRYRVEVLQTSTPRPSLANAGRAPREQRLGLEGMVDLSQHALELTLWQGADRSPASGMALRIKDGQTLGRRGQGAWQPVDISADVFAPGGDPLAFLASAANIQFLGSESRALDGGAQVRYERYAFDLDGRAFAAAMRERLEQQLRQRGELPAGVSLDTAALAGGLRGRGELWLDADGLPRRLSTQLDLPAQPGGEQIHAAVTTDYFDFDRSRLALISTPFTANPLGWLGLRLADIAPGLSEGAAGLLLALPGLLLALVCARYWRSRRVYRLVVPGVIAAMLLTPLLQGQRFAAAAERRQTHQEQQQQAQRQSSALAEGRAALTSSDWDPHQPPVAAVRPQPAQSVAAASLLQRGLAASSPSADSDGDGLSDSDEARWGTCPAAGSGGTACAGVANPADSDGDGLSDGTEVNKLGSIPVEADSDGDTIDDAREVGGFSLGGQQWYLDPSRLDSNADGLPDGLECPAWSPSSPRYNPAAACPDSDSDGTPDVFDPDNDNDGVPDAVDLSPNRASAETYSASNPLSLSINSLTPNTPVYVDFQLRPTEAAHITYQGTVLDWPSGDTAGQIQHSAATTFADSSNPSLRASDPRAANGDIRLVPMLEITMPYAAGHYANLPVKSGTSATRALGTPLSQWLDTSKLAPYAVNVRDLDASSGGLVAYVPLTAVADSTGGGRVALAGRMLYWPSQAGWGSAQQVRVVWLVEMLTDACTDTSADPATCARSEALQVVQTYNETWRLTGLNVTENRGMDVALLYEDPARDNDLVHDSQLWLASWNLGNTFLRGRDCDSTVGGVCQGNHQRDVRIANLKAQIDTWSGGATNNDLAVSTFHYEHQDLVTHVAMTETNRLLNTVFTPYATRTTPTILFAREVSSRALNMNDLAPGAGPLTLDLTSSAAPLQTSALLRWASYQYVGGAWQNASPQDYLKQLHSNLAGDSFFQPADSSETSQQEAEGKQIWAQAYYSALYQGSSALVELNGSTTWVKSTKVPESAYAPGWPAATFQGMAYVGKAYLGMVSVAAGYLFEANGSFWTQLRQAYTSGFRQISFRIAQKFRAGALNVGMNGLIGLVTAAAAAGALVFAIGVATGDSSLATIGVYILSGVTLVVYTLYLANIIYTSYLIYSTTANITMVGEFARTIEFQTGSTLGLLIALGVAWGLFLYQGLSKHLEPGTVAFNMALSMTVASTIVTLIFFILGLTLIGTVIVLLVGIIDAVLTLFGKTGISAMLTEVIADSLYDADLLVTNLNSSDRLSYRLRNLALRDPGAGFIASNALVYTLDVTSTISYNSVFSESEARRATFRYALQGSQKPLPVGRGDMASEWQAPGGRRLRDSRALTTSLALGTIGTGINRDLSGWLYLTESFDAPYRGCWQVANQNVSCTWYDLFNTSHLDIGRYQVYDILPDTLSGFAGMAWGGAGAPALPVQQDQDGDGLLNPAVGGTDPNDRAWDSDGDGLGDQDELARGSDPLKADADGDGLTDQEEVLLGTNTRQADSDGDGLNDDVEVRGWLTSYGTDANGKALVTRVWSDPRVADSDGDGLNDLKEYTFGLNPNVATDPALIENLVRFSRIRVDEANAPALLLRFEEQSGADSFPDSSGAGGTARCASSAGTCPTAGQPGRYGRALVFDGANDYLELPDSTALNPSGALTLAAWVKLSNPGADQKVIGKGQNYLLGVVGGQLYPEIWDSAGTRYALNAGSIPANTWTHLAVTWQSGGQLIGYINGLEVGRTSAGTGPIRSSTSPLRAGVAPWDPSAFRMAGGLDEAVMLPRALSAAEIGELKDGRYNPDDLLVRPGDALRYSATVTNTLAAQGLHGYLSAESSASAPAIARPSLALRFEDQDRKTTYANGAGEGSAASCSGSTCPGTEFVAGTDQAARFDGADDFLTLGPLNSVAAGETGTRTLAFSLKLRGLPAAGQVMQVLATDSTTPGALAVWVNSAGNLVFKLQGASSTQLYTAATGQTLANTSGLHTSGFSFAGALNTWVALTFSYEGFTSRLLVNGSEDSRMSYTSPPGLQIGPGRIGAALGGGAALAGSLNNLTLTNSVTPSTGGANLMAQLNFDDDTGYTGAPFFNDAGSRTPLTCDSSATCPALTLSGALNQAALFDGVDDYLTLPDSRSFPGDAEYAITLWAKLAALPAAGSRFYLLDANCQSGETCLDLSVNASGQLVAEVPNWTPQPSVFAFSSSTLNTWTKFKLRIQVGWNSSTPTNYTLEVNDRYDSSHSLGGISKLKITPARLGRGLDGSGALNGALDNLAISGAYTVNFDAPPFEQAQINRVNGAAAAACVEALVCPSPGAGKFGGGLTFDGTDDYLTLPAQSFATGDYTIGAWFKSTTWSSAQTILGATDPNNPAAHGVLIEIQGDGKLRWLHRFPTAMSGSTSLISPSTYNNGVWHYLTAVRAGTRMTLYVDGAPVASGTAAQNASGPLSLVLGRRASGSASNYFKGSLDELTVIPAAVTAAGVQTLMSSTYPLIGIDAAFTGFSQAAQSASTVSGSAAVGTNTPTSQHRFDQEVEAAVDLQQPISYPLNDANASSLWALLPFEEPPGATVFANAGDVSYWTNLGLDRTRLTCDGSGCPQAGLRGKVDRAVAFDGVDDRLAFSGTAGATQTVAVWVKADRGTILDTHAANNPDGLQLDVNRLQITVNNDTMAGGDRSFHNLPFSLPENEWSHLAVTVDTANWVAKVYVNGAQVASQALDHPSSKSKIIEAPVLIGAERGDGGDGLHGYLDDLRIYSTVLSASQIKALYEQSAPKLRFEFDESSSASTFADSSPNGAVGLPKASACATLSLSSLSANALASSPSTLYVARGTERLVTLPAVSLGATSPLSTSTLLCAGDTLEVGLVAGGQASPLGTQAIDISTPGSASAVFGSGANSASLTWSVGSTPVYRYDPPPGTEGKIGHTALFDGAGWISIPNASAVNPITRTLTIQGWIKPGDTTQATSQILLGTGIAKSANGFGFGTNQKQLWFSNFSGTLSTGDVLRAGMWQHVALVYDSVAQKASIYVDGAPVTTWTGATTVKPLTPNTDDPLFIGARAASSGMGNFYTGQIDELSVYARALNDAEIASSYLRDLRWYRARSSAQLTVDTDAPTVSLLSSTVYRPNIASQLAVAAVDPTSYVALVDVGLKAPGASGFTWQSAPVCVEAAGSGAAWCPRFDPTALGGQGVYQLQLRAVDAVGNQATSPVYTLTVDSGAPTAGSSYSQTALPLTPERGASLAWSLALSGPISDPAIATGVPGSGVAPDGVQVSLLDASGAIAGTGRPQPASLGNGTWSLSYRFAGERPAGSYRIRVTARDAVGNQSSTIVGSVLLDARPPSSDIDLRPLASGLISTPLTLGGSVGEQPNWGGALLRLHFDDLQPNGTFYDSTGQGNQATCTAAACPTPTGGVFGQALRFDKLRGNWLSVPNTSSLELSSGTLSAWVRPTWPAGSNGYNPAILAMRTGGNVRYSWQIRDNYSSMYIWDGTNAGQVPVNLSPNQWYHLAVVQQGSTWTGYVNGVAVGTVNQSFGSKTGLPLRIGTTTGVGEFFSGMIDEVQIYNRALSPREVYALAQSAPAGVSSAQVWLERVDLDEPAAGRVVSLDFEERPGASAFVNASGGESATCAAACPVAAGGLFGQALAFSGGEALTLDAHPNLATFTQAAWVKPTSADSAAHGVLGSQSGVASQRAPSLSIIEQNRVQAGFGDGSAWNSLSSGPALTPGTWNHIAASFDGTTYRIYVNGALSASTSAFAGKQPYPVTQLTFGQTDTVFQGRLDRVRIYNRALSDGEIAVLARQTGASTWQNATLAQPGAALSTWSASIPAGSEGLYQLHIRGTDAYSQTERRQTVWRGTVDTLAPRLALNAQLVGSGTSFQTVYTWSADDLLLSETGLLQPCAPADLVRTTDPTTGGLTRLSATCQVPGAQTAPVSLRACDAAGHCADASAAPAGDPRNAAILSPAAGSMLLASLPISVTGTAFSPDGLSQIQLLVNGSPVQTLGFGTGVTSSTWAITWTPPAPGSYTLLARMTDAAGNQRSDTRAVQAAPSQTVSVTLAGSGSGTVTSAPAGINCGGTCSASYILNTPVQLTANPAPGSVFVGWSGACTGTAGCIVGLGPSTSVTATFALLATPTSTPTSTPTATPVSTPTPTP